MQSSLYEPVPGNDNLLAEYRQTLETASIFDVSNDGHLEATGPEAPAFLHNLSTNDIKNVPLGGGCEAYFCDHRAQGPGPRVHLPRFGRWR